MMKKLFSLFAALTLSVGLWAQSIEDVKAQALSEINDVKSAAKTDLDQAALGYESNQTIQDIVTNAKFAFDNYENNAMMSIMMADNAASIEVARDNAIAQIRQRRDQALSDIEEAKKAAAAGITVNVTVPAGTPACYFYGEMSSNKFVEMTKLDDTHYTIDFPEATDIGWGYKFCWENGNWNTANADPAGDFKVEPEDGVITVEVKAWTTAPAIVITGLNYVDAIYYDGYWDFDFYNDYNYEEYYYIYPEVYFMCDEEAPSGTSIVGTYTAMYAGYWKSANDSVETDEAVPVGTVTVTCVEQGIYNFVGSFVGTDGKTYTWTLNNIEVYAYDGESYEDITLTDGSDPTALPNIDSKFKIQNSKLIKNGHLIIRKDGKTYNAVGF